MRDEHNSRFSRTGSSIHGFNSRSTRASSPIYEFNSRFSWASAPTLHSSLFTLHCSSNHHSSLIAHDYLIQLEFRQTQHLMHNASYLFVDGCVIRRIGDLIALVVARQVPSEIRN